VIRGSYYPKLGYKVICKDAVSEEPVWWWKKIWKYKYPLKTRIYMWLALDNKVLTWDNLQKRNKCGPGHCSLCKLNDDIILHLLILCSYTVQVWMEIEHSTGLSNVWSGNSIEECFRRSDGNVAVKSIETLSIIVAWESGCPGMPICLITGLFFLFNVQSIA